MWFSDRLTGRDICGVVTGTVRAADFRIGGTASSESVTTPSHAAQRTVQFAEG